MAMVAKEQSQNGLIGRVPTQLATVGQYHPEGAFYRVKDSARPDHSPLQKKRKASKKPRFPQGLQGGTRTVGKERSTVRPHRSARTVRVPSPAQAFARALAFAGVSRRRARALVEYLADLGIKNATREELAAALDQAVGW